METYKKLVIATKSEPSTSVVTAAPAAYYLAKKLFGDDDFHAEKALTARKNFTE